MRSDNQPSGAPRGSQADRRQFSQIFAMLFISFSLLFIGFQINVDQRCLIPRPETEFLIELIKNNSDNPKKILDVGTGTGCIALMLKKLYPESTVDACDISLEALDLAKENSEINNLEINLFQSDLLSDIEEVDYDIIVANLPYIPTENLSSLESEVVDYEPLVALDGGVDGLLYINRLIKEIEEKDITNLTLFLEVDTSHATTILNNLSHWKQVELEKDLVERDRYIIAKR